jgi:hypothetical protein
MVGTTASTHTHRLFHRARQLRHRRNRQTAALNRLARRPIRRPPGTQHLLSQID